MDRDIYTIKLEDYKKAQHITVNKNSFIDINLRNEKDVLNEITNICKKAYRCSECGKISLEDDTNDNRAYHKLAFNMLGGKDDDETLNKRITKQVLPEVKLDKHVAKDIM